MEAESVYFKMDSPFIPWKYEIILIVRRFWAIFLQAAAEQMIEY